MKSLFEEMGGTYRREGDYLTVPESVPVGIWGQRRRRYLREHRKPLYVALSLSWELDAHLADIDHQAEEMLSYLMTQMIKGGNITEQLKAKHQMRWVEMMNNIHSITTDIICMEIIYS